MRPYCIAICSLALLACESKEQQSVGDNSGCLFNVVKQSSNGWTLSDPEVHFNYWGDWTTVPNFPQDYTSAWYNLFTFHNVLQRLSEYGIHEGSCDTVFYTTTGSTTYVNDAGAIFQSDDAGDDASDDASEDSSVSVYAATSDGGTPTLLDSTFPVILNAQIQANQLPYPNDNTLYVVMLPPGVSSQSIVRNNWGGYHDHAMYGSQRYAYAIITYGNGGFITTSHEIYEASTNPDLHTGYRDLSSGEEAADICEGSFETIGGYLLQEVWSQQLCQCQ